ncbi:glutathione-regulated potassium-efflux system protein KefC [bacterium BMS3Bbin08]|nr:glutathione-regulated potassium-efflux system protein KefC [bacterium BMS3Bbin08]
MHELVFLKSLVIILGISAIVIFALGRIKIPSIVGFLLAGMLLGPHGLNFIEDLTTIQTFSEIGVILLLFTIGIEFSMSRFLKMRLEVFGIGGLYVLMTVSLTALISYQWLGDANTAVFTGFLVGLSSTAIVMKLLSDRAEIDTPHGRISVGILIFQDLCLVPFMLFIPILSGGGGMSDLILTFGKALAIIAVVLLSARWIIPNLLHQIVRARNRELFVISILIMCFGIAFLTSEFGLSLALGAFLAGLAISESEYSHEATSTILPFKDSFNGLFFISVGMLMDTSFFINNTLYVLSLVFGIIIIKFVTGFLSMYLLKRPLRTSIQSSMDLGQVGEFSFVLAVAGLSAGLISNDMYQWFLSASVFTMLLTPFIMKISPFVSSRLSSHKILRRLERHKELSEHEEISEKRRSHVIIIGFGLNGRNLARVLREADISYLVLEFNADTVREMKKQGEPIYYGDGTKGDVLLRLGIKTARVMVIAISDPASCRNIVTTARRQNPELFIIVRTRYASEVDDLLKLGADEVIPEEFETSVEIFSRVLGRYQIPKNEIFNFIDMIREDGYRALRQSKTATRKPLFDKYAVLSDIALEVCTIHDTSPVRGKSIEDLRFRTKTGATIIVIERENRMHTSPDPKFSFKTGDIVFITGKREDINKAIVYLTEGKVDG